MAVTMQAQRETPPDMQCKDKFLVQSVVAPPGSSTKEVSQDLVRILYGCFCTKLMLFADLNFRYLLDYFQPLAFESCCVYFVSEFLILSLCMQFNKELGNEIHEAKLKVLYVSPPQPPSPITESNEEEEDKVGPVVDNGDRHFPPNELV